MLGCQPRKWVWGLLPLLALWAIANLLQASPIAADLGSRGAQQLASAGHPWASVAIAGRDATLSGEAPTPEAQAAAATAVQSLPGVRRLAANATTVLPVQTPYAWSVAREGNRVTLAGFVPNEATRAAVRATALRLLPGADLVDQLRLARGQPANFDALTGLALEQVGKLSSGKAELAGSDVSVSGVAPSTEVYNTVVAAFGALPQGFRLASQAITAPTVAPYVLSAVRAADGLTLAGHVPSEGSRAAVVAAARAALPGIPVTDRLSIGSGAPPAFEAAGGYALGQLARLSSGTVTLRDATFSINGTAATPASYADATRALAQLPAGFTLREAAITAPQVSPFTFSADKQPGTLTLSGFVPDEAARTVAVAAASGQGTVVDQLAVATGAPAGFAAWSGFGLGQMERLASGRLALSDSAMVLSGTSRDPASHAALLAAVQAPPAGLQVDASRVSPPVVRPYQWQAERTPNGVVLSGFVPDEDSRREVRAAAARALPGVAITDAMQVAAGAPAGLPAMAGTAFGQLAGLQRGIASLVDNRYSLIGLAATPASYASLTGSAATLPQGFTPGRTDIEPAAVRPYTWQARKEAGSLVLSGFVPSAAVRTALASAAAAAAPGATITDTAQIAAGAPARFREMAIVGLGHLGRLESGSATLNAGDFSLAGAAANLRTANEVGAAARTVPEGYRLASVEITAPTAKPYVFTASKAGTELVLTGFVPDEATRAGIVAAAGEKAGIRVVDKLELAAGAPAAFTPAARHALAQVLALEAGTATLSDASYSVTGRAPTSATYQQVTGEAATGLPAGFSLGRSDITAPAARPYAWSATRRPGAVVLEGNVPDDAARAAIIAEARRLLPASATVTDRLQIASGAPAGFGAMTTFALQQLGSLSSGQVSLSDQRYSVTGAAVSLPAYGEVIAGARALPAGFALERAQISAPPVSPFVWNAVRANGAVTLSGFVPDESARAAMLASTGRLFAPDRVVDQLQIASGAPAAFVDAAGVGLAQLARLRGGRASVVDTALSVFGDAETEATAASIRSAVRAAAPGGYRVAATITAPVPPPPVAVAPAPVVPVPVAPVPVAPAPAVPVPVPAPPPVVVAPPAADVVTLLPAPVEAAPVVIATCQQRFNELLSEPILFDTARATIRPESAQLLTRLVEVAASCPLARIEVGAHTDSDGADAANLELSERRARTVVEYLVRGGVQAQRLAAVGYGETRPIAPNTTPEGKQKNRRVEFVVR
jgi:outer membrane protein OmpA-like peptidoglycan-associated protein/osmotically-inducible protein OsmY